MAIDTSPPKKPSPKWLTEKTGNFDRARRSKAHETRVAEALGGRRIPRSGAKRWSKWDKETDRGDVETPDFHLEHKRTDRLSLSLKKAWLDQIREGAKRVVKDPGVVVTFEDAKGRSDAWLLVSLSVAQRRLGLGTK